MSTISKCKQKSKFLRQLLKTRDLNKLTSLSFTIVHRSKQGQVYSGFLKTRRRWIVSQGFVLESRLQASHMAVNQQVFSYLLSFRVARWSSNAILSPVETHKLSFHSCVISYRLFALAKTDAENCNTYPCLQNDIGRFAFRFCGSRGRHQESYLVPVPRLCKERGQKLEYNHTL